MPDKSDSSPEKEEEVLDLIEDSKKLSRRERQRARVEALENPRAHKVEKAKSEALDIFSDDEKPAKRKAKPADNADHASMTKIGSSDKTDPEMVPQPPIVAMENSSSSNPRSWFPISLHASVSSRSM